MKQRDAELKEANRAARGSLAEAFVSMRTPEECRALLRDLTTPAELEALVDRWRVARLLDAGLPYREINEKTGVSVTTIGRVARFMEMGEGGYRLALDRLNESTANDREPGENADN